jgi:hypothetical protein
MPSWRRTRPLITEAEAAEAAARVKMMAKRMLIMESKVLGRARVEVRRSGGGLKEEEVGKTLREVRAVEQNHDDHPETYMCARLMGHHTRKPCQIGRFSLPRVRAMMQHDAQAAHSGSDGPFFPFRPVFWQCAIANHEQY